MSEIDPSKVEPIVQLQLQPSILVEALERVAYDRPRQQQLLMPVPHDVDVVLEPERSALS